LGADTYERIACADGVGMTPGTVILLLPLWQFAAGTRPDLLTFTG